MTAKKESTPAPTQRLASKVEAVKDDVGTKKSSPATITMQDWIQRELAKAPPLTEERRKKVTRLLLG
ncbi:hypothetical protein ACFT9I_27065 [Streptomyces sp. NPDC057137]|uniref:hypothetical protein n=1 Tax=Streptomyces sp. NPDC057137 TaxID=3346030 RepID=UPI00363B49DF